MSSPSAASSQSPSMCPVDEYVLVSDPTNDKYSVAIRDRVNWATQNVVASVVIVRVQVEDKYKFVVLHRHDGGIDLPMGCVDASQSGWHEEPHEAAYRELHEELLSFTPFDILICSQLHRLFTCRSSEGYLGELNVYLIDAPTFGGMHVFQLETRTHSRVELFDAEQLQLALTERVRHFAAKKSNLARLFNDVRLWPAIDHVLPSSQNHPTKTLDSIIRTATMHLPSGSPTNASSVGLVWFGIDAYKPSETFEFSANISVFSEPIVRSCANCFICGHSLPWKCLACSEAFPTFAKLSDHLGDTAFFCLHLLVHTKTYLNDKPKDEYSGALLLELRHQISAGVSTMQHRQGHALCKTLPGYALRSIDAAPARLAELDGLLQDLYQ